MHFQRPHLFSQIYLNKSGSANLVSSWHSLDGNSQKFQIPNFQPLWPPQSQFQPTGSSSSAAMDFGSALWVPKSTFFFLFSTYLQLPVGKAKAQWKHRGFPFKITRERRGIKRFYSSAHDFPSCSWMLNVLSQFPTPQKEFSAQTQRSWRHLLSLLGVGGL